MKITGSHTEIIECPECRQVQEADVTHTPFGNIYFHVCIKCDFLIMESEWNLVNNLIKIDMEQKEHECKSCKSKFIQWIYEYNCQHCEDGTAETSRDIDFNGTGYHTCIICKGTGAESAAECDFCCEDCMLDYSGSFT